jgi:hypothetical protein
MPRSRSLASVATSTCGRCGTTAASPEDGLPAGWSLETNERGITRLCLACTRDNIRAIEGKLPEEWWE